MRIRTEEATVKTASVEMKVLTISGKQMTLAVFRQLDAEPVIDEETGELRGVPWGRINYFWGDCIANHLHIIWQKGDELRRACVSRDFRTSTTKAFEDLADSYERFVHLRIAEGWQPDAPLPYRLDESLLLSVGGYRVWVSLPKVVREAINPARGAFPEGYGQWSTEDRNRWDETQKEKSRSEARAELHQSILKDGPFSYASNVAPKLRRLDEIVEKRRASYKTLEALDLLLIAV